MEQDINGLIEQKDEEIKEQNYFKLNYKSQKVENLPEFKKWYERVSNSVYEENKRRERYFFDHNGGESPLLLISFCNQCCSYVICTYNSQQSFITCNKCSSKFCAGCLREPIEAGDISSCLKGFIKLYYLRIIYQRSDIRRLTGPFKWLRYYLWHILFCLFCTPLYLGFISHANGLMVHPNYKKNADKILTLYGVRNQIKLIFIFIFSFFRALLMFPYIINFFPFMFILLIPSIFSFSYYKKIFIIYITAISAGCYPLIIADY